MPSQFTAFIIFIFRDKLWFEERSKQAPVKRFAEVIIFEWLERLGWKNSRNKPPQKEGK